MKVLIFHLSTGAKGSRSSKYMDQMKVHSSHVDWSQGVQVFKIYGLDEGPLFTSRLEPKGQGFQNIWTRWRSILHMSTGAKGSRFSKYMDQMKVHSTNVDWSQGFQVFKIYGLDEGPFYTCRLELMGPGLLYIWTRWRSILHMSTAAKGSKSSIYLD